MNSEPSAYDSFAWIYNKHWGNRFTAGAIAVLEELVLHRIPEKAAILDLCSGTGQLAGVLSERGYTVTGLDGSEEMLVFARENAPGVAFIHADACHFSLPEKYDLVTSFFDSLNHVITAGELEQVFRNVHSCLNDGGLFVFDMNLEPCYLQKWHGFYGIVEDDHVCIFPQSYDEETRIARFDATIFRLDEYWYRSEVHLLQKCYDLEEIISLLEKAGLEILDVFGYSAESGRVDLSDTSDRAYFLCRK